LNFISFFLDFSIKFCIFLLLLVGVPLLVSKVTNNPIYTDPQFQPYFIDFKNDASKNKTVLNLYKLITIFSNRVDVGVAAYCIPSSKTVVISASVWKTLNEGGRKALLYHEWGHCILRREHVDQYDYPALCPISVMYPFIDPLKKCYLLYQDSYNRELFTNPFNFKKFSRSKKL
jgi:hypothetical protein